jgi:hypothetical protein
VQEVTSRFNTSTAYWKGVVVPQLSRHLRRITFDRTKGQVQAMLDILFLYPLSIPRATELSITCRAAGVLFGYNDDFALQAKQQDDVEQDERRKAFRQAGQQIEILTLSDFFTPQAVNLLMAFPRLVSLTLSGPDAFVTQGIELPLAIASLHTLKHLTLHLKDGLSTSSHSGLFGPKWLEVDWSVVELHSLAIRTGSALDSTWEVVQTFSTTLRRLELDFPEGGWPFLVEDVDNSSFPNLHTLVLKGHTDPILSVFDEFSRCSPLRVVDLEFGGPPEVSMQLDDKEGLFLPALVNSRSTLYSLTLKGAPVEDLRAACEWWDEIPVVVSRDDDDSAIEAMVHSTHEDERVETTYRLCNSAERVLKFGMERAAWLRELRDSEGAAALLGLLDGLTSRLLAERD